MYKVFFNGRIIFLTNDLKEGFCSECGFFYKYNSSDELVDIIDFFETVFSLKKLYIYHHDLNKLFDEFQKVFTVINLVGGLIINQDQQVLMVKRWGKWDLPKGELEKSADPTQGLSSNLNTECGKLQLKIEENLDSTFYYFVMNNERILKKVLWYRMEHTGPLSEIASKQQADTKWVDIKELPEYYPLLLEQVQDVFKQSGIV